MAIIKIIDQSLMQVVSDRPSPSPAIQLYHDMTMDLKNSKYQKAVHIHIHSLIPSFSQY